MGNYALMLSDFSGSITSSPASLTVSGLPIAPAITAQPQSVVANLGSNVTFTVTATGTIPLSYKWYFNGAGITGAVATSYTVTNVQTTNLGNYLVWLSRISPGS